uniref:Xrn1 N-terminal domain-containing protein n=1 Tax=viral metagenome TaxID=1070528 RepID=A0A6C0HXI8_9ZZZZ
MGIPSYFSYLLRKHPYIITALQPADNLYLDSNSIIYDMVSSMDTVNESDLLQKVCEKIDFYLSLVQPKRVFIAFDGIPPMAKMKQQKDRRFKSWIQQTMSNAPMGWNTMQITPGTSFMNALDTKLHAYFKHHASRYESFQLSTSKEAGEGEHKLFAWIRDHPELHQGQKTLVYGLDSDLIILSLHHLQYGEIRLLREAPAFMLQDRELHVLDVPKLAESIREIIGETKLSDYIFMTLFLGNDFMPHFPALNLRTNGFDTLFRTYTSTIQSHEHLFDGEIQWPMVQKFIAALALQEENIILKEYYSRNRFHVDASTEEKRLQNLPMLQREKEHFICPSKKGWQNRYYDSFFTLPKEDICKNYVDMLAWNMQYYTTGCTNWRLYYSHMYPPLLEDLVRHIPTTHSIEPCEERCNERELLMYVLPPLYYKFIPEGTSVKSVMPTLEWSYCRYTWESHVRYVL